MIKLVCFDIDDTLMDFHKGEEIAFYETMKQVNVDCDEKDYLNYKRINAGLWKALERNEITKDKLKVHRFECFKQENHKDFDSLNTSKLYELNLGKQCFLFDDAKSVVERCFHLCDLAVTTNGISHIQRSRLKLSGLERYFKYLFISEELNASKPQIEYYEAIMKQSNCKPEEILIIGDSLSADMLGAQNSGCKSVWYNPKHLENSLNLKIDYVIDDLNQIISIVEEII